MAEDQIGDEYQPRDAVAEAMSRLLSPSGVTRDPGLTAATEAVAWAILAAVRRLHVIAYRETFEEAAARSGMTVREVADDPEAAARQMTAARLAREEQLAAALDSLAEIRKLAEDAEHWIPSVKHGAVSPVDVLQKALAGAGTPAPEPCRHERQRNAGTQISPLMVCADCGVQVTPAWGPGKDAE